MGRLLADHGALVIDSDVLAREVVEPGTEGFAQVVARFGSGIVAADGGLDRPALGRIVFADEGARRDLEAIIHPRVRARSAELSAAAGEEQVVVEMIPLLVETGQAKDFDDVIVVDLPVEEQVRRLRQRNGLDEQQARARVAAQATREERLAAATIVLDNAGSLEALEPQVDDVWARLMGEAAAVRARDGIRG